MTNCSIAAASKVVGQFPACNGCCWGGGGGVSATVGKAAGWEDVFTYQKSPAVVLLKLEVFQDVSMVPVSPADTATAGKVEIYGKMFPCSQFHQLWYC